MKQLDINKYLSYVRDPDITRIMLDAGVDVNYENDFNFTALMRIDNAEIAKILIDSGADVNAMSSNGHTVLMWAMIGHRVEVVKLLLEHGANINAIDRNGYSILMRAIFGNNIEIIRAVLEHDMHNGYIIDMNVQNRNTSLTLVAHRHHAIHSMIEDYIIARNKFMMR